MAVALADLLIIVSLIGGVFYAHMVNRRVKRLMSLLQDLEPAVQEFSLAVDKSQASVTQMHLSLSQAATSQPSGAEQSIGRAGEEPPLFSTQRVADVRDMGVRVIRDKQELVRQFFDATRTERKA